MSGTSVGLIILLICSIPCKSGDSPPWQQNIFSSMIAAMGKQLKQSVNIFHNFILYRRLPKKQKVVLYYNNIFLLWKSIFNDLMYMTALENKFLKIKLLKIQELGK